jgi:phosphatidylserine/phosphatidylglycerophosphate/cardiolipin synthase-like enzyme
MGVSTLLKRTGATPYTAPRVSRMARRLDVLDERARLGIVKNCRRVIGIDLLSVAACLLAVPAAWGAPAAMDGVASERATPPEVLYSPEDHPADRLVALYESARKSIYLAIYGLTYPPIIKALVAAHKRGVDVRVITDREKLEDRKQRAALDTLRLAGIPIKVNRHDGLMHIKQAIIDDRVNTSGSMNQTTSAARYNDERLDVVHDAASTQRAKDKFLKMWADAGRFEDWR